MALQPMHNDDAVETSNQPLRKQRRRPVGLLTACDSLNNRCNGVWLVYDGEPSVLDWMLRHSRKHA